MILAVTFSIRVDPEHASPHYVSRPDRPPRADGMGGAEFGTPETGDAEVHPHGVYFIVDHPEHPHGAPVDADPVVTAEVPVDIYLDGNRPGGRDLQGASLLSARPPWLPPWRILKRTFR
jgi:hypothetical protein